VVDWFRNLSPVLQALLATLFTWGVTALGASLVVFFRNVEQKVLDFMMGFAAGVMIAASFWSLLSPGIELAEETGLTPWVPAVIGFLLGGAFLYAADKLIPHLHVGAERSEAEGISTTWRRSVLLVLAITLHNIPEGLAIGVSFGAAAIADIPGASVASAAVLALGIGIQNFPEGTSVSVPLRREGMSRRRAFYYGQLSGMVEPISGVIGAAAVLLIRPLLPYALSFAAGAMIFVVVEELVPESQRAGNTDLATSGTMLGFAIMMLLDVALGG
jgi:ZIP family zinc transporter